MKNRKTGSYEKMPNPEKSPVQRIEADYHTGLDANAVEQRRLCGLANHAVASPSRTVGRIYLDNIYTLFNVVNTIIAVMIAAVGDFRNLLFMGVVVSNTAIGIFQEIKAKRTVDRLSILTEPKATVVRDGHECKIAAKDLVLDDVMLLAAGNQIGADGLVLHEEGLEADESLVTGEANAISKHEGDEVLSGSFVTAGKGYVRVMRVGRENYASKLTIEARREKKIRSELMTSLNRIVTFLSVAIIPIGILLFCSEVFRSSIPFTHAVTGTAGALVGMIPEGLILLTSIAFAVGVINLGRKNTLVQTMPCIENLARVDVLCLDKTGTITSGLLQFERMEVVCGSNAGIEAALSALLHALPDRNPTHEALAAASGPPPGWVGMKSVPFSSARKYSGVTFEGHGTWVLGAPEFVLGDRYQALRPRCERTAREGYRVIVLAFSDMPFTDEHLPQGLEPRALLLLSDQIRPEAPATFAYFREQGVSIRVISGDSAVTAAAVAKRAGLYGAGRMLDMSGVSLDADYRNLVDAYTVFGRVTPYQKRALLRALKANGHTVAMTGDGVNDVLALKEADCSIAMPAGSEAARQISDLVLLGSDFSTLKDVVFEGRRVINNIERVATLYLSKVVYACLLAVAFILITRPYPLVPIQLTIINVLTVGAPSFFLAIEPNRARVQGSFLKKVLLRSVPPGLSVVLSALLIQLTGYIFRLDVHQVSAITVMVAAFISFNVLYNVCKPFDLKKVILFVLMAAGFLLAMIFAHGIFYMPTVFNHLSLFYLPHIVLAFCFVRLLETLIRHLEPHLHKIADRIGKHKSA